jgi:hypothetical protein
MVSSHRGHNSDFEGLLGRISQEDSDLGVWLRYHPSKFKRIVDETAAVREFYQQNSNVGDSAACFEDRLSRFSASGDADKGFIGELEVAYTLAQRGIPHRFIKTNARATSPDIELIILGTDICLEIKMNDLNFYHLLSRCLWKELHIPFTAIRHATANQGHRYALTRIAVQLARERIAKGYGGPIHYKNIEGKFDLTFPRVCYGLCSHALFSVRCFRIVGPAASRKP